METIIEAMPGHVGILDTGGNLILVNRAWRRMSGEPGARSLFATSGNYADLCQGADDAGPERPNMMAAGIRRMLSDGEPFEIEYPVAGGRTDRWFRMHASRFDERGNRWALVSHENISDRRMREQRHAMMLGELRHRVKNTLAVVQSLAAQTMRSAASLDEFGEAFGGRLQTLERAHVLLTAGDWQRADLVAVIENAVAPYRGMNPDRVTLTGPDARMRPNAALALTMMLHEIATNAAKYGALSLPGGTVTAEWSLDGIPDSRRLTLVWRERGGPPVVPPQRRGFGTTLIEFSAGHEFQGEAVVDYQPTGVVWRLDLAWNDTVALV